MSDPVPPRIEKLSAAKQKLLDQLLDQNAEGTISEPDRERLESLVSEAEELILSNARRLAEFAKDHSKSPPVGAVPVTVWVASESVTS